MPATIAVREIHPDLPIDRVWQAGRRLYARCGRHSRLSDALHAMGAKWDTKEQALWVGSGKRARFTPLALRHHAAVTRYNEIRTAGHWVAIPYGAVLIRARVRELGGVWDPDTKRWALPTPADQIEIMELVQIWRRARDAEAEKRRQAMRERRQAERILSDLAVRAELLRKAAREEQRWGWCARAGTAAGRPRGGRFPGGSRRAGRPIPDRPRGDAPRGVPAVHHTRRRA